jgi:hypothetical protein
MESHHKVTVDWHRWLQQRQQLMQTPAATSTSPPRSARGGPVAITSAAVVGMRSVVKPNPTVVVKHSSYIDDDVILSGRSSGRQLTSDPDHERTGCRNDGRTGEQIGSAAAVQPLAADKFFTNRKFHNNWEAQKPGRAAPRSVERRLDAEARSW